MSIFEKISFFLPQNRIPGTAFAFSEKHLPNPRIPILLRVSGAVDDATGTFANQFQTKRPVISPTGLIFAFRGVESEGSCHLARCRKIWSGLLLLKKSKFRKKNMFFEWAKKTQRNMCGHLGGGESLYVAFGIEQLVNHFIRSPFFISFTSFSSGSINFAVYTASTG